MEEISLEVSAAEEASGALWEEDSELRSSDDSLWGTDEVSLEITADEEASGALWEEGSELGGGFEETGWLEAGSVPQLASIKAINGKRIQVFFMRIPPFSRVIIAVFL